MLFIIPSILIMCFALLDYKKSFMLYLLFQMIWFPDTQVFSIGGSWININLICALFYVLLYKFKINNFKEEKLRFPYTRPMILIAISLLLTCFSSLAGPINEFVKAAGLIVIDLAIVYIMWKTLTCKDDYEFLFKGITIIVFIACIYIFYEKATGLNPVLDYKLSTTSNTLRTYRDFQQWDNRGYRCYSIFDHTICTSMILGLYVALVVNLFNKYKRYTFRFLSLITSAMCIPAIFFTQQRAGMVLLLIAIIPVIDFKKKRFWKLVGLVFIALIIVWPYISNNFSLFLSILNPAYKEKVSGSSLSMRLDQLNAVYHIMLSSPFFGLGENFQRYYTGSYASQALGYESLWFEQMAKHGLLGVISYIYMIYYSVYKIPKLYKSKEVLFISLAYWTVYTMSSTPYFRTYFLYAIIFFFIKSTRAYESIGGEKLVESKSRKRIKFVL